MDEEEKQKREEMKDFHKYLVTVRAFYYNLLLGSQRFDC